MLVTHVEAEGSAEKSRPALGSLWEVFLPLKGSFKGIRKASFKRAPEKGSLRLPFYKGSLKRDP